MSERLKGKIGIVTGAGTGIGRACAIALAREGAQVALVGRRRDRVEEVTDEIGVSAFPIPADISRTSEIERLLDQTVRRFGGLNFLPARVVGSTETRFRGSKAIPAGIAHPAGHEGEEVVRPLARRRTPARREYHPHPSFGDPGR